MDAALKLEGEELGRVSEGTGAAIGDPGPEKYAMEEAATERGIGIEAIVIKEDEVAAPGSLGKATNVVVHWRPGPRRHSC